MQVWQLSYSLSKLSYVMIFWMPKSWRTHYFWFNCLLLPILAQRIFRITLVSEKLSTSRLFIVQLRHLHSQTFSEIFLGLRNCINSIITEIRNAQQSLKRIENFWFEWWSWNNFQLSPQFFTQKANYWVSIWILIPTAQHLDRFATLVMELNLKTFNRNRLTIAIHYVKTSSFPNGV